LAFKEVDLSVSGFEIHLGLTFTCISFDYFWSCFDCYYYYCCCCYY